MIKFLSDIRLSAYSVIFITSIAWVFMFHARYVKNRCQGEFWAGLLGIGVGIFAGSSIASLFISRLQGGYGVNTAIILTVSILIVTAILVVGLLRVVYLSLKNGNHSKR